MVDADGSRSRGPIRISLLLIALLIIVLTVHRVADVVRLKLHSSVQATQRHRRDDELVGAVLASNKSKVRALLQEGASPNARNAYGQSVLMLAAGQGSGSTVQALLAAGADVAGTDTSGATALHWAVGAVTVDGERALTDIATVRLLIQHGASIDRRTVDGETPLDWALRSRAKNRKEVIQLLRGLGGSR